jgi:hypothetical protein
VKWLNAFYLACLAVSLVWIFVFLVRLTGMFEAKISPIPIVGAAIGMLVARLVARFLLRKAA